MPVIVSPLLAADRAGASTGFEIVILDTHSWHRFR